MRGVWIVVQKEMRETLRDRRTLLIMVVVPVVLYPLLLILSQQLALFGIQRLEGRTSTVGVAGEVPEGFREFVGGRDMLRVVEVEDAAGAVRSRAVAAAAVLSPPEGPEGTQTITVVFDGADERSQRGRQVLMEALRSYRDTLVAERIRLRGLPETFARPLAVADSSIARPEELGGYALGRFLPLLLILITLLGAFYPAIDLAAGEKERGTLETLMTAPVPAEQIVFGKFITVASVGIVAACLNLGSMLLTFQAGLFQISGATEIQFSLSWKAIALIFASLVPLAVLFGALFLGISVRARSFKEAQNALTPVYMLVLIPALLPIMPGIDFNALLALVPVAGIALLFRELMGGRPDLVAATLALLSTVVYAAIALRFAAQSFGSEEILFGDGQAEREDRGERRGLARLLLARRERGRDTPTLGQALGFVVFVALLFFYLGVALQVRLGERGLLASEWLVLFGSAVAFVVLGRFDPRATFSLRRPDPRALAAALLIIAGGTPLAWFLAWLQSFVIPVPWELLEGLSEFIVAQDLRRVLWLLLVVAVTPAICEEAVFRGVLLAGTRDRLSPARLILLNGLVFGAFHLSFQTAFRFLPTAWLGVLLAWAVWRSRSIWTGVLMHLVNNGSIVLMAASPFLVERFSGPDVRPPFVLLPLGLMSLAAGVVLMLKATEGEPARARVGPAAGSDGTPRQDAGAGPVPAASGSDEPPAQPDVARGQDAGSAGRSP